MGEIYLTQNANEILDELEIAKENLRIFEREEFKIADAKEVIAEAYISSSQEKFIALIGKIFNKEAQNALLKVLEEPPHNIHFLIFTPYKNALIPTIRSRMKVIDRSQHIALQPLELDVKNLSHLKIYEFLHSLGHLSRMQTQEIIQRLFITIEQSNLSLTQEELDYFDTALRANHNHAKLPIILAPILISLLQKKQ